MVKYVTFTVCEELSILWDSAHHSEHRYLKAPQNSAQRRYLRNIAKKKQNDFDRLYKKLKRRYERQKLIHIELLNTKNPKEFWKEIRNLGPRKKHEIPMKVYMSDGSVSENINEVLCKWETDFKSLLNPNINSTTFNAEFYNVITNDLHNMEDEITLDAFPELNLSFTLDEVRKIISEAKVGKAAGIEGIPNEVLKNLMSIEMLFTFFNKVFQAGITPSLWKLGIIKPLPKGSLTDPKVPLQYRGIALLSTIYKLYTGLLNARLLKAAEEHNVLREEQNGFRKNRSCVDHIYSLTSILRHRLAAKQPVLACFVDAEKAFDRIDRSLMFYKLLQLGIHGKFYKALKSIYLDCKNAINLNGYFTEWFSTDLGVKQGDVISPTLFSLYVNDLIADVKRLNVGIQVGMEKIPILAFADDIVVLGSSETELQQILDLITEWGQKWRMSFNCSKSNVLHFRKKNMPITQSRFMLGGMQLEIVDKYKYLGVVLNDSLDFSYIADTLADAGGRALGAVVNKYKHVRGLGFYTYSKLFKSCVNPVLDYASEVWGYKDYQSVNKVQNRAIRTFLGVSNLTSNLAIHGDFGWTSAKARRHLAMIRYYNRIINMDPGRLPKVIFFWERSLRTHGWAHEVEVILSNIGMSDRFNNNLCCSLDTVWAELFAKESILWQESVQKSRKLRTYRSYKLHLETEPYVFCISNREHRSVLSKLRAGVLPLEIETARWRAIPANERLCKLCNSGSVEDESHFVFDCTVYSSQRSYFFDLIEIEHPGFALKTVSDKWRCLMSQNLVNAFAKFVHSIYNLRQQTMYIPSVR